MPLDPRIAMGVNPIQLENPANALARIAQLDNQRQQNALGLMQAQDMHANRQLQQQQLAEGVRRQQAQQNYMQRLQQGAPLDPVEALNNGLTQEQITFLANKDNLGRTKVARTVEQAGPTGAPQTVQLDEYGRPVGDAIAKPVEMKMADTGGSLHPYNAYTTNYPIQKTMTPGEAATDRRAGERLAFDKAQPKGIVHETDAGTMLVDPRAGTATPVINQATGAQLSKPLKDIPATVNAKIIEGKQSLSNIDKAIQAVKENPDAFGIANMIPGVERMRQGDEKGVDARAQVANIGSLTLHDRSGAAVSASEFPRLAPFIPSSSDKPEAIVRKLTQMRRIAEEELGLFSNIYGEDSGYKPSPALKAPAAKAGGVVNFSDLK